MNMSKSVKFAETKNKYGTASQTEYTSTTNPIQEILFNIFQEKLSDITYGPYNLKIGRIAARGIFAKDSVSKKMWAVGESRLEEKLITDALYDLFGKIDKTIE